MLYYLSYRARDPHDQDLHLEPSGHNVVSSAFVASFKTSE